MIIRGMFGEVFEQQGKAVEVGKSYQTDCDHCNSIVCDKNCSTRKPLVEANEKIRKCNFLISKVLLAREKKSA